MPLARRLHGEFAGRHFLLGAGDQVGDLQPSGLDIDVAQGGAGVVGQALAGRQGGADHRHAHLLALGGLLILRQGAAQGRRRGARRTGEGGRSLGAPGDGETGNRGRKGERGKG